MLVAGGVPPSEALRLTVAQAVALIEGLRAVEDRREVRFINAIRRALTGDGPGDAAPRGTADDHLRAFGLDPDRMRFDP